MTQVTAQAQATAQEVAFYVRMTSEFAALATRDLEAMQGVDEQIVRQARHWEGEARNIAGEARNLSGRSDGSNHIAELKQLAFAAATARSFAICKIRSKAAEELHQMIRNHDAALANVQQVDRRFQEAIRNHPSNARNEEVERAISVARGAVTAARGALGRAQSHVTGVIDIQEEQLVRNTAMAYVVTKMREMESLLTRAASEMRAAEQHVDVVNVAIYALRNPSVPSPISSASPPLPPPPAPQAPAPTIPQPAPVVASLTTFQQFYRDWYECGDTGYTVYKIALWFFTTALVFPALALVTWGAWDYCCNRGNN